MGKSAWCDLNKDGTILKVDGMCPNRKCSCQKQVTFTPKQFQFEGKGFKNTIRKTFKGSQKAWDKLLKPAVNTSTVYRHGRRSRKQKSAGRSSYVQYSKEYIRRKDFIINRHRRE